MRMALAGVFLTMIAAGPVLAQCTTADDLAAVKITRGHVDAQCDCANAITDGLYKRCALTVVNNDVANLVLPRECRKFVIKCAAKSTCGRPAGYHPCCKTNRLGKTRCKIVTPERCRSGPGGSHCVSFDKVSCCDACTGPGLCSPSGAFLDVAN